MCQFIKFKEYNKDEIKCVEENYWKLKQNSFKHEVKKLRWTSQPRACGRIKCKGVYMLGQRTCWVRSGRVCLNPILNPFKRLQFEFDWIYAIILLNLSQTKLIWIESIRFNFKKSYF